MKTHGTLFAVGLVAALAAPTWAQTPGIPAAAGGYGVQNAVADSATNPAVENVGFVLLGDHHASGGGECHTGECHTGDCHPVYNGCQTFGGCPEFSSCPDGACFVDSCCGNKWEFRGGWINMKRVSEDVVILRDTQQGTGNVLEVLNGDDFDFDFTSGLDAGVIYWFDGCTAIEFRHVWINEVSDSLQLNDIGNTAAFVNTSPNSLIPNTGMGVFSTVSTNESEFQTSEVNVRSRAGSRITLIGGFRYAQLDESLAVESFVPVGNRYTSWDTENDLYGMQIGAEVALVRVANDCFRIDGLVKGGVYYNDVRSEVFDNGVGSGLAPRRIGSGDDSVAFLGEFGLFAHWQVHHNVALRAGYQAIWFNSVATAEHQVGSTGSLAVPPLTANVDTGDNAIFHGVNLMFVGSF